MDQKDFFAQNNACGQNLLQLVAKGNAVIAELLRLKDYVPPIYRMSNKQEAQKYADIILDFGYFKVAESHEAKLEASQYLRELDEEFRDNHLAMIERFYFVFESIHSYVSDLNRFLQELHDGVYIHQSLESIMGDIEGRQVTCEALFLYGVMLLIVDVYIEGATRERLLVSYYRYTPQRGDSQSHVDEVCKLLRDTGRTSSKTISCYPEDYFSRVPIDRSFVNKVINRLRLDDIYNQIAIYPSSDHQSTAYASQAAMLCVCLFFSVDILHERTSMMREIVDKFFLNNWVVSLYMGYVIDLIEWWEPFKAAKAALTTSLDDVKTHSLRHAAALSRLTTKTGQLLKEGNLTEEYIVDNVKDIIEAVRECNVTVRWLMLHTCSDAVKPSTKTDGKKSRQCRETVIAESGYSAAHVFKLLLDTSQLELTTIEVVKSVLNDKDELWEKMKREGVDGLRELSEVFEGTKPLMRAEPNVHLARWFSEISKEVDSLRRDEIGSNRKIVQLIHALEEVQEFHQLEKSLQVVQFLSETRRFLHRMIKTANVKEKTLITLQIIGDFSYAWKLVDTYTQVMQQGIERDPTLCIRLRAVFLKLASALEVPLLRINQIHSEDLVSVSQYYSGELEVYAREVLQIVPKMMFDNMARIIEMQTSVLKELPTRLDKNKLKEYSQLNERFEFARLTDSISVYAKGIRTMKSTLVGVICLDPKQLLEDGIRRELVRLIATVLDKELTFGPRPKDGELQQKLQNTSRSMDGFKRSFEYIQDYVSINGLKIWQEEVTRIINYNVEQECNTFLRTKVHDWESVYQNRHIPIPRHTGDKNFVGRLAHEILRLTDPRCSVFLRQTCTWYNQKSTRPVVDRRTFELIASAIEITGLTGLDRFFAFATVAKLQKVVTLLTDKTNTWSNTIRAVVPTDFDPATVANLSKWYSNLTSRTGKLWPPLLELVLQIGQLQLMRVLISFQLRTRCKFDAKHLESSLSVLDATLLQGVRRGDQADEQMASLLTKYFDWTGTNDPLQKIYITAKADASFATNLFVFVTAQLQKLTIIEGPPAPTLKRTVDFVDGIAFTVAVHTIFRQFHPAIGETFLELLTTFVRHWTKQTSCDTTNKNLELPSHEIITAAKFLGVYGTMCKQSRDSLYKCPPEEIEYVHELLRNISNPY